MTIYCGVDFHAGQQTICYCDTADGQVHLKELRHEEEDTRAFHSQLAGEVIVGLEQVATALGSSNSWRASVIGCGSVAKIIFGRRRSLAILSQAAI
jgi:hypothetical protein